jgi:hypothetical protein
MSKLGLAIRGGTSSPELLHLNQGVAEQRSLSRERMSRRSGIRLADKDMRQH